MKAVDKNKVAKEAVKMYSIGRESSLIGCCSEVGNSTKKKEIYFPNLWLVDEQTAPLKGKKVNDIVKLVIEGRISSHSSSEGTKKDGKTSKSESFDIELKKIGLAK